MARQFIPKRTMAIVVARLLHGISSRASDDYVATLKEYKTLVRLSRPQLADQFRAVVANHCKSRKIA